MGLFNDHNDQRGHSFEGILHSHKHYSQETVT